MIFAMQISYADLIGSGYSQIYQFPLETLPLTSRFRFS